MSYFEYATACKGYLDYTSKNIFISYLIDFSYLNACIYIPNMHCTS